MYEKERKKCVKIFSKKKEKKIRHHSVEVSVLGVLVPFIFNTKQPILHTYYRSSTFVFIQNTHIYLYSLAWLINFTTMLNSFWAIQRTQMDELEVKRRKKRRWKRLCKAKYETERAVRIDGEIERGKRVVAKIPKHTYSFYCNCVKAKRLTLCPIAIIIYAKLISDSFPPPAALLLSPNSCRPKSSKSNVANVKRKKTMYFNIYTFGLVAVLMPMLFAAAVYALLPT